METTDLILEQKESSAVWDSDKGSCSEAPCGAAGEDPVQQRAGETPLIGKNTCPLAAKFQRTLRV